ncbi:MAG TPA: hypothetical protein VKZ53_05090 [Candidatus Angelobacter sp.]|nr:hypothetical protein [Candidatus Angelobacter sp.]
MDLRKPIGLLFSILGISLMLFGSQGDPSGYRQSLGVNVNLYWGAALLAFGIVMLFLTRQKPRPTS